MIVVSNRKLVVPEYLDHYVANPAPLGNPFGWHHSIPDEFRVESSEEAVEKYKVWIQEKLKNDSTIALAFRRIESDIDYYTRTPGSTIRLLCWCAPAPHCHANVLLRLLPNPHKRDLVDSAGNKMNYRFEPIT